MSLVKFVAGTYDNYEDLTEKDADTLYFITDDQTIYKGDTLFGGDMTKQDIADDETVQELISAIFEDISGDGTITSKTGWVILTADQVTDGVPNIQEPQENTIYFAPVSADNQSGSYNAYSAWVYINSSWNRLGSQSSAGRDGNTENYITQDMIATTEEVAEIIDEILK